MIDLATLTLVEIILGTSAILTALGVIWAKGVRPSIGFFKTFFKKIDKIDQLARELVPNGGASLRDAIDRIESQLMFFNQRQKALVQDISTGVIETDADGKITWANRRFLKTTDMTLDEISGNGWINVIHADDVTDVIGVWNRSSLEHIDFDIKCRVTSPEGYLPVRIKGYSLKKGTKFLGHEILVTFLEDDRMTINNFT